MSALKERFSEGQEVVVKGLMLLPFNTVSVVYWQKSVQPFLDLY